jgi:hypothetical protein
MHRLDEAQAAAQRALKLDPDDLVAMGTMANIAVDRHDLVGGIVWAFRIFPHNSDPSLAVNLAFNLDSLGYFDAGDAWMKMSRQLQPENNVIAESYDIDRLFQKHEDAKAVAATKAFLAAHQEKWELGWDHALHIGCMAAARAGKLAPMRAALERDGFLPVKFEPAALHAWAGAGEEGRDKLDRLVGFGPCAFYASAADLGRRQALQAAFQTLPPDKPDDWVRQRDARLRNDREALAVMLSKEASTGWYLGPAAEMEGVADDPRVRAHLREVGAEEAKARARLPAELAKVGLSMLPPVAASASAAHLELRTDSGS